MNDDLFDALTRVINQAHEPLTISAMLDDPAVQQTSGGDRNLITQHLNDLMRHDVVRPRTPPAHLGGLDTVVYVRKPKSTAAGPRDLASLLAMMPRVQLSPDGTEVVMTWPLARKTDSSRTTQWP